MVYTLIRGKAILMRGTINASLGGLVAITGGLCNHESTVCHHQWGGCRCTGQYFTSGDGKLRLDDVVDAVTVHGFCGAWGTLAAGYFLKTKCLMRESLRYKAGDFDSLCVGFWCGVDRL